MSCRICFDDDAQQPLFQPCKCTGSIAHVHQDCLFTWIETKRSRTPRCELCKTPYSITYNRPLEAYEQLHLLQVYFLVYPSWHILSTCILQILFTKLLRIEGGDAYFYAQATYQSFYAVGNVATILGSLRSPDVYLLYAIHNLYLALFFHVYLWLLVALTFHWFGVSQPSMLLSIVNQCYLGIYPILHVKIIQKMNEDRIRILQ